MKIEKTHLINNSIPVSVSFLLIPFQFFLSRNTCRASSGNLGSVWGGSWGSSKPTIGGSGATLTLLCKHPIAEKNCYIFPWSPHGDFCSLVLHLDEHVIPFA